MKCANCGKEFGKGTNCQFCGVDRVTGLGNYSGYIAPVVNSLNDDVHIREMDNQSYTALSQTDKLASIICYACGEVIPADSKFCPYCAKQLYVDCPRCGYTYSSKYPVCNQCGTNREEFIKILERQEREEREREKNERKRIKRIAENIENRRKMQEQTIEGRAELERERQYLEECRKKWRK